MPITHIHSFLVHPAKNEEEPPPARGARLPQRGQLFTMLTKLYQEATVDCDIDIVFRAAPDGQQANPCRELLVNHVLDPTMESGRSIALKLQGVTTHRSGLGLLFLIVGEENNQERLLLARFPANQGVIAEEHERRLDVQFIERVFMKSARAYKSAIYIGPAQGGFWDGKAVDKQIEGVRELSNYWIGEFLESELRTTGAAGTKRLAVAFRQAIRSAADPQIRRDLLSAAELARGWNGRRTSAQQMARAFGLSDAAEQALIVEMPRPELFEEVFEFDVREFDTHAHYRSVELDNGAFLIGDNARFDQIFQTDIVADQERVRYTTEGRVVKEQLKKTI